MAEMSARDRPLPVVVSGGQTGVDQGALTAALDGGIRCGGWCPKGRRSEAGTIPIRFPVRELTGSGYSERTRQNVVDSDGTAIIFDSVLEGGTRLAAMYCEQVGKPHVLIDATTLSRAEALQVLDQFVSENGISVLNVAGPRASKWPAGHDYAYALLTELITG